ncbi:hypothetical protein QEV12_01985 [Trueperella pyogenes]|uniref:hypothetical protein n=1 Tax=Trueperella pyogenes TaxID=1661 RepID=UPI0032542F7D
MKLGKRAHMCSARERIWAGALAIFQRKSPGDARSAGIRVGLAGVVSQADDAEAGSAE